MLYRMGPNNAAELHKGQQPFSGKGQIANNLEFAGRTVSVHLLNFAVIA